MVAALLEERQWALDVWISRELGMDEWGSGILSGVYQVDSTDETSCSTWFTYDWLPYNLGYPPDLGPAKLSKVLKSTSTTRIGRFIKRTEIRPGRGPGQSRAEYSVYKNERGEVVKVTKDSYDRAGNFQHRKDKTPMRR
jgi:hypothetical protein